MSISTERKTSLAVTSDIDTELFLIGPDLAVRARGVGELNTRQSPGLYKIKAMRAGTVKEELFELKGNQQKKTITVEDFPAVAPVARLLKPRAKSQLEDLARDTKVSRLRGADAQILVLSSEDVKAGANGLRDIRLLRWSTKSRPMALDVGNARRAIGNTLWSSARLCVPSGTWILEIRMKDRVARQAIVTTGGWETRVFIHRRARDPLNPLGTDSFEEWIDTSIQMAAPASPVVYEKNSESAEVARLALAAHRRIIVSRSTINDLLVGKFWNPIMGLTAAHLMLEALERGRLERQTPTKRHHKPVNLSINFTEADVDEVLQNLKTLFVPTDKRKKLRPPGFWPPDLVALFVRAGCRLPSKLVPITAPPMFAASWSVLRKKASSKGPVWIDRSLWSSIALSAAWGPYFVWEPDRTNLNAFIKLAIDGSSAGRATSAADAQKAKRKESAGAIRLKNRGAMLVSAEKRQYGNLWQLSSEELASRLSLPATIFETSRKSMRPSVHRSGPKRKT